MQPYQIIGADFLPYSSKKSAPKFIYWCPVNRRKLLHKPFPCPFETVPTVHEDEAADILVEGKDGPHGNQSPTHADTQHVAAYYLYRPHHADAHVDGEVDVARAA